jgi:hypothetical protein
LFAFILKKESVMALRAFVFAAIVPLVSGLAQATHAQQSLPSCGAFPAGQETYACSCTGGEAGTVWGSGPYTGDSDVCVAARHAGVIGVDGGPVEAILHDGQDSYAGSLMNGVETRDWGAYGVSFILNPKGPMARAADVAACTAYPSGEASVTCSCAPGAGTGSVWGSGPYTADSDICGAAIHAGVIGDGGGVVTALGLGGLEAYRGSERAGVATRDWGSYGESFVIDANQ